MRVITTIFIAVILFSANLFAQTSLFLLPSTAAFSKFRGSNATIFVREENRGGMFTRYIGNDEADGGMVFTDSLKRKWKRQTYNNKISIKWYGAVGIDLIGDMSKDAYPAIIKARDYCYKHTGTILYIPYSGGVQGYYSVSQTLDFADHDIGIEGENVGANYNTNSRIKFPANVTGFNFNRVGLLNKFVTLKNIYIQGGGNAAGTSYSTYDLTKHGVQINVNFNIENVYVTDFSGNGFQIVGGSDGSGFFNIGSVNRAYIKNCEANNCYNGFYVQGGDANQILFDNCSGVQCKRWGFLDKSFLGNTYNNCHTATNALQEISADNYSLVNYAGLNYVAVTLDEINNTRFRPDLNPTKWERFENGPQRAWDSTRRYYSAGAYCSTLDNASHVYTNCYSEGYQPASRFAGRSMLINGLHESALIGGAQIFANGGTIVHKSIANFELPLTLGNGYGEQSSISTNQSSTLASNRRLELRGNRYSDTANILIFADGTTKIQDYYTLTSKPVLWVANGDGYDLGDKTSMVITQNYNSPAGKILDIRSNTLTYNGGLSRFTAYGDGKLQFGGYTSATAYTGIAVAYLQVNAKGEVITSPIIIPEYADNAAAIAAGLRINTQYRTGDILKIVH